MGIARFAAIIGGEAVILHGIPRTTLDLDILYSCGAPPISIDNLLRTFIPKALLGSHEVNGRRWTG